MPNILVVLPKRVQRYFEYKNYSVYLRSSPYSLKVISADVLILFPGLTDEQRNLAVSRTRASRNPKIIDLEIMRTYKLTVTVENDEIRIYTAGGWYRTYSMSEKSEIHKLVKECVKNEVRELQDILEKLE